MKSTLHIDRLANQGVKLGQFYNTARCSPSRASLLTGRHPQRTGVGIGYLLGTSGGGLIVDALHARRPRSGRVLVLQLAQFGFAITAIIGTQFNWGSIAIFAGFWAVMGFMQGSNPGVNRPIVMAVVPPELRGAASARMLSVFEALAFIIYNLTAGFLGETFGLTAVMLWIPGILMIINGVFCTLLYRTYPRDVANCRPG